MCDEERIPFLDKEKTEHEINLIVKKGVIAPEPFYKLLHNMQKQIGIRFLFRDVKEMAAMIMMMSILMATVVITGEGQTESTIVLYGIIMLISPILYGLLALLGFLNSKVNGTFELEMTCKYNLYQIAAFRMMIFSAFCFLVNTLWVALLAVHISSLQFIQAFMISTTSLLLFSLLFFYGITSVKTLFCKVAIMIGWFGINAMLLIVFSDLYNQLLLAVPWYLYGIIICLAAYLHVKKLKEVMLQYKTGGVLGYVNG